MTVDRWRDDKGFRLFFFVRKDPGLRLRFAGPDLLRTLEPMLRNWLEHAVANGKAAGWERTMYEPEQFRFGGPGGMALTHRTWDLDSRLALAYEELSDLSDQQAHARVPPQAGAS